MLSRRLMSGEPSWTKYPTPILPGTQLGTEFLWVKNDGLSGVPYGGNKVRKLARLLPLASARGATRLVTAGAAGSHHVLAVSVFGRRQGFDVMAHLWPMRWSEHAGGTLASALREGLVVNPVGSAAEATARLALGRSRSDYVIHIGGAGLAATLAYEDAVYELARDIESGLLPEPERIVLALGTGSTAAGLLAGVVRAGLRSVVVGVQVAPNPFARWLVLAMAGRALRAAGASHLVPQLSRHLVVDASRVGGGYGHPTAEGARATEMAARVGLALDPTYTAKAFGRALADAGFSEFSRDFARQRLEGPLRTLYWHTLSALPPLDAGGPRGGPGTGSLGAQRSYRSLFIDPPLTEAARR
jgi:D-cysteine desulfhydrase